MRYKFTVEAEVERTSGKFVSKDEIGEQIAEALESADYGSWDVDESQYETTDWDVQEVFK